VERAPFPGLLCGRGVGSSILASLSEAGGNDRRQPACKPLPPRSLISVGRHSECAPLCSLASGSPVPSEEWPPPILCFRLSWQRQKILRSLLAPGADRFGRFLPGPGILSRTTETALTTFFN